MRDSLNQGGLQSEGFQTPAPLPWLEQSWANPAAFFKGLLAKVQKTYGVSLKSDPFAHYDFYYDIFLSRSNREQAAFVHYDANGRRHPVTYDELKQLVDERACDWEERGFSQGSCICLVYPLGLDLAIGLLAALKLGLVVSIASPGRPYLLKRQLAALAPDVIATSSAYTALMGEHRDKLVEAHPKKKRAASQGQRPRVFQSGETAARLFDFSLETPLEPVEIPCDALYLHAVRDGIIALNLSSKDVFAAPGWSVALTQPFMLLSVFLAGATFLDVKPGICAKSPAILDDIRPTVLGVNQDFRDFLSKQSRDVFTQCKFWFRTPADDWDKGGWQAFVSQKGLEKRYTGVIKWHPQAGGILAFSRRRQGLVMETLMPSAGMAWQVVPLPEGGGLASPDFGRMTVVIGDEERMTPYLFVKSGVEWLSPESYVNQKQERFYPRELVEGYLKEIHFNRPFIIVPVNRPASVRTTFDLVIFAGARQGIDEAGLTQKLSDRIARHLGREYCPDRMVFQPVLPRLTPEGTIDTPWCMKAYATGRMNKTCAHPVFKELSRLKEMILTQQKLSISTT
ncbi:MAG TPA: hypothetical protein DHV36_21955 [Desulfobacteraceae bacterium]|nr:hypothetical protein [Desulfobacteraceae bacterium]